MASSYLSKGRIALVGVGLLVIAGIIYFSQPDRRTTGERIGDAADALPHGVDKAAGQLRDRTPAERAGDAIDKAATDVSSAASSEE